MSISLRFAAVVSGRSAHSSTEEKRDRPITTELSTERVREKSERLEARWIDTVLPDGSARCEMRWVVVRSAS